MGEEEIETLFEAGKFHDLVPSIAPMYERREQARTRRHLHQGENPQTHHTNPGGLSRSGSER